MLARVKQDGFDASQLIWVEQTEVSEYPGYTLAWHDEFSRDGRPDPNHWTYEQGFVRNNELQWYQPDNARCENGMLIIEARREQKPNPNYQAGSQNWKQSRAHAEYTSSSLRTRGLHEWTYGRFEMRARIKTQSGLWPAFWTLGSARSWPGCGEIDIMEYYRGDILANACWASARRWSGVWDSSHTPVASFNDPEWDSKFHIWRMDWDDQAIRLYLDDALLNTIELDKTINQTPDQANPFKEPHYLIVNLALGGTNGGDPNDTPFPSLYEIDYVRVYQRE
ncbi:MAG: glycoside hydrolase family 16 protein [Phycisphaerae bacterium]|nr:glycoside hydrolase family 16 protein [Phycisphaerae bacterium]